MALLALFLQLTCVSLIYASPGDPVPTKECVGSFNTSQGFTLHPESLENGAELLDVQRVNSSSACLSHCCALTRCSLALVGGSASGGLQCLLFDCTREQKSVCTLLVRQGFEASLKLVSSQENDILAVDCTSPSKAGPCRAWFPRWYFNATEQVCQEFIYGGCLPNLNNYESEADCQKACSKVTEPLSNLVPVVSRSVLSVEECSRQCLADEFHCSDGCCVPSDQICDGEVHCLDKSDLQYCDVVRDSYTLLTAPGGSAEQDDADVSEPQPRALSAEENKAYCYASAMTGRCRAAFQRWYYEPAQEACLTFTYGGCGGNKNNFETKEDCLVACSWEIAYCYAPAVTGRCRAAFPRWYYDPAQQNCLPFIYGGCGGNNNNFVSKGNCLAACWGVPALVSEPPERKLSVEDKGNWEKSEDGGKHDKQHHSNFHHQVSAISMVVLLAICILILLGGVVYFIVKLTKADHVVSYHRTRSGADKETLINTA
ncbi:kunitz-type protease inhibitor 2 isoform X1 [Mobula birostris]|uniref:kunitz-type protease inhibitor 2 isoform X1 n=1 Tax=Mobula birostris TaxID=1983395 RepID=UPI003B27C4B9